MSETAVAGEPIGQQSRPITKQQPVLPQPVNTQPSQPADLQRQITSQQTELPSDLQSESVGLQQSGISQPVTTRQTEIPQPVTIPQPDSCQPITTQRPSVSQPVTVSQPDFSQPISIQHPTVSQPVTVSQPDYSQPISIQHPTVSQPIAIPPVDISRPINTQQPTVSQPISISQPDSSRPVTMQQPPLSQQITLQQQQESTNLASQSRDNFLPSAVPNNFTSSHQRDTPTSQFYPPSGHGFASNYSASVPTGSFLRANSPPYPATTSPQMPFATSRQIPQPTFTQDIFSHPPPLLTNAVDFSTPQARAARPPMWPRMPPVQMPPVPGSSMQYLSGPTANVPPPGVLCRQPFRSPSPEANRFVQSRDELSQAMNFDTGQTEKFPPRYGDGLGDGPPPYLHPYGPPYHHEYPTTGRYDSSVPSDNRDIKTSPSDSLGYNEKDLGGNVAEDFDHGAGGVGGSGGGRDAEAYGEGVYSAQCNVPYFPGQRATLYTSPPNVWTSPQPMQKFQATAAEFPTASGYYYMPQNPGMETPAMMYHMPPGAAQWDVRGSAMDYTHGFSMHNLLPSAYQPSMPQGSEFTVDQSAVSARSSVDVSEQSGADVVPSIAASEHNERDMIQPRTESRDSTPESCENIGHDTLAGTFYQGDSILTFSLLNAHCTVIINYDNDNH